MLLAALLAVLLAACGGDDSGDGEDGETTVAAVPLEDCTPETMQAQTEGTLTVGTDSPAYPPYFARDDPANGRGFESATAYAIAEQLGFAEDQVEWVEVPFNSAYAPGPKDFDFDINQVSVSAERAEDVDFSAPYYKADQAVVTLKDSDFAAAATLTELAGAEFGVQTGTTSREAVDELIRPGTEPQLFDTSNEVVSALEQGQIDAVVVDTPTALYMTSTQVPKATIVGEFSAPGGDEWGTVLAKDSPLSGCVSAAIEALRDSGELERLERQWINDEAGVAKLQ